MEAAMEAVQGRLRRQYKKHVRDVEQGKRLEGNVMGYAFGIDLIRQGKQLQKPAAAAPEKTYAVKGSAVATPYSLRLELALEAESQRLEFTGDVAGMFRASVQPLPKARLRTADLQGLLSRGSLFHFSFYPTRFEVRFYDPNNTSTPLGLLQADSIPQAGAPGQGYGKWNTLF